MVRLWEEDGQTQTQLAEGTFRDAPSLSRTVVSMEKKGWVRRARDGEDGRVRRVFLSERGRQLESKMVPVVQTLVGEILRGIPERDVRTTIRTLRRIVENVHGSD